MANPRSENAVRKLCVVCAQIFPASLDNCPDDGTPLVVADAAETQAAAGTKTGSTAKSLIGQILGSYRLLRLLGEGGVGAVYEAEHLRLGRKMAIKLLRPEMAAETDVVVRFFNEARAVNEIRHPNIIDIEDFVQVGGRVYLLMELVEGSDLATILDKEGALDPLRVVRIGAQVAGALARVHDKGIIHRDLKPDNLHIGKKDGEDFVKVLDFGIAKFTHDDKVVTRNGLTMGTPEYMSPEQIRAQPVDGRADVYALGVILYEALTDHRPFEDPDYVRVLKMHCNEPVVPPSKRRGEPLPAAIEAVVMRCLEKSPAMRFSSMEALHKALIACLPGRRRTFPQLMRLMAGRRRGRTRQLVPPLLMALAGGGLVLAARYHPLAAASWRERQVEAEVAPSAEPAPAAAPAPVAAAAPAPLVPTPVPSPAPTLAEVEVELVSRPSGAELFLGPEEKPLGPAPRRIKLPMSSDRLIFKARFADGGEVEESVIPDRDLPPLVFVQAEAAAAKAKAAKAKRHGERERPRAEREEAPPSPASSNREGVVDPFGGR